MDFFLKNNILAVLIVFMAALCVAPAQAQDQFTSTFNFESSTNPYNWAVSAWGECIGVCNGGEQFRNVTCRDNAGNAAPSDASCSHTARPSVSRNCDLPDCRWEDPAWGVCEGECNKGNQHRNVRCLTVDNVSAGDQYCSELGDKPAETQDCELPDCQWVAGSC